MAKGKSSAKTRSTRRGSYPNPWPGPSNVRHVSAPSRPAPEVAEEFVGMPNGSVWTLRVTYFPHTGRFRGDLIAIDGKRSLPVSFAGDPHSTREAFSMAKAWLDRVGVRGAN